MVPTRRTFRALPIFAFLCVVVSLTGLASSVRAGDKSDALSTVADAVATIEDVQQDLNQKDNLHQWLPRARAVLIVPDYYKGGLIVGGAYGNGILMVRDDTGSFSPPAFYRLAGGSLGLQIGGQRAQTIFLIMTEKGLNAILTDQFKVGATVGVSMAHLGANLEGATTSSMTKDILAISVAQGAYGGVSFEGAAITFRADWNQALYGSGAGPRAILFDRRWNLPEAQRVYEALAAAGAKGASAPSSSATGTSATPVSEGAASSSQGGFSSEGVRAAPSGSVSRGSIESAPLDPPAPSGNTPVPLSPSSGSALQ